MVMARLLRNRLESYVNNVNRAEADYTQQAMTYNSAIQAAGAGTPTVMKDATGKDVVVGGKVGDQLKLISGNVFNVADMPSPFVEVDTYSRMYGRDADGNVSEYVRGSVQPTQTQETQQQSGNPFYGAMSGNQPPAQPQLGWVKHGGNLAIMPGEPVVNAPKEPNLTVSNINELQNPSADPAGLAMQQAYGMQGKSQLAGDVENSKVSAFADPEDPNDMASRGILARTLAGQLG